MAYLDDILSEVATENDVDVGFLKRIIEIESGGDPNAVTGSYKGLFQLGRDEWSKYGRGNIYDPRENARAGARKIADDLRRFEDKYGRKPAEHEIYLIHQQGEGGFAAHSSNPDAPAWENMASTLEGRQKGPEWAKKAIWGNIPDRLKQQFGSVDNVTSQQFTDLWKQRVGTGSFGDVGAMPANATATSGTKRMDEDDPIIAALMRARAQYGGGDPANGLDRMLGVQPQQQGGLLGALSDPTSMAYLGMILKGLSPYSELDPQTMLAQAQRQAEARRLQQERRQERGEALDIRIGEAQAGRQQRAETAREAAQTKKDLADAERQRKIDEARAKELDTDANRYAKETLPPGTKMDSPEWGAKTKEWWELENAKRKAAAATATGEKTIPGESAGRMGLADVYLSKAEKIGEQIDKGELSGWLDVSQAKLGIGERGQLYADIESGVDALRRQLTGAGMPESEAKDYARRYLPGYADDAKTLRTKHDRLVTELTAMRKNIMQGRGGAPAAATGGTTRAMPTPEEAAAELRRRQQGR